ncbi:MAG TPA: hypothetical protein PK771_08450 [Spirochaetota bacterium]|nr:hypothetical protein [Spirochaetota bacterium]
MKQMFTGSGKEKIRLAIVKAESETSAEIVPAFFYKSDDYVEAVWKSITIWLILSFVTILLLSFDNGMNSKMFIYIPIIVLFSVAAGWVLPNTLDIYKKLLISKTTRKKRVMQMAKQIFLEKEVFNTKDRTGVLLFMSFFEKEAVILGDTRINKLITQNEWNEVMNKLVTGMKEDDVINTIEKTILSLSELFKKVPRSPVDKNELKDEIVIGGN